MAEDRNGSKPEATSPPLIASVDRTLTRSVFGAAELPAIPPPADSPKFQLHPRTVEARGLQLSVPDQA